MFNFDTKIVIGKRSWEIKDNTITPEEYGSNQNANVIIETVVNKIVLQTMKYNLSASFEELLADKDYLVATTQMLLKIKSIYSQTSWRRKTETAYDKTQEQLERLINNFEKLKITTKFSKAQRIVLDYNCFTNYGTSYDIGYLFEIYNPITKDTTEIDNFFKEIEAFDFTKYAMNINEYNFKEIYLTIGAMKKIEDFAKEDLVNWGMAKITRHLNEKYPLFNHHHLRGMIRQIQEHLFSQGVKVREAKETKTKQLFNKLQKLSRENSGVVNYSEFTQEELITLYKNTTDSSLENILHAMSNDTVFQIMDADKLLCVSEKTNPYNYRKYNKALLPIMSAKLSVELSKELYTKTLTYFETKKKTPEFLFYVENEKHVTMEDFSKYLAQNQSGSPKFTGACPESFYNKILKKISCSTRYSYTSEITGNYIVRMTKVEKEEMLLKIATQYNQYTESQHIHIEDDLIVTMFKEVSYTTIQEAFKLNPELLRFFKDQIVENKYLVNVELYIKHINTTVELLNMFDAKNKKRILLEGVEGYCGYGKFGTTSYGVDFKLIFNTPERIDFIIASIEQNKQEYYADELGRVTKGQLEQIFNSLGDTGANFPISFSLKYSFSNTIKKNILKKLNVKQDSWGHQDLTKQDFFKTLTREDLMEVYGDSFVDTRHRKYLCHAMTEQEVIDLCLRDKDFLRYNIETVPISAIWKYRDETLRKQLIGDRRDPENRAVSRKLVDRLNKCGNAIDFIMED